MTNFVILCDIASIIGVTVTQMPLITYERCISKGLVVRKEENLHFIH